MKYFKLSYYYRFLFRLNSCCNTFGTYSRLILIGSKVPCSAYRCDSCRSIGMVRLDYDLIEVSLITTIKRC